MARGLQKDRSSVRDKYKPKKYYNLTNEKEGPYKILNSKIEKGLTDKNNKNHVNGFKRKRSASGIGASRTDQGFYDKNSFFKTGMPSLVHLSSGANN